MRIKHLSIYAGEDGCYQAGSVRDVPQSVGLSLVAGGFAERLDEPVVEYAESVPKTETAAIEPKRPRRRRVKK